MLTNRELLLPYILPYMAYVAIASVPVDFLSREINYGLRLIVVGILFFWARKWLCSLRGPLSPWVSACWGIVAGLFGAWLWIVLLDPFVVADKATQWSESAFLLRLVAAGLMVPVIEELMMRGYVFRLALQWDQERRAGHRSALYSALDRRSLQDVGPGEWSWAAVLISTLVFTAGHAVQEWPASVGYGLLMSFLWIRRKDLLTCVVAHGTTNIALAVYVLTTGQWQYW